MADIDDICSIISDLAPEVYFRGFILLSGRLYETFF